MSLIEEVMEDCTLLDKVRTDDGEGGMVTSWKDSVPFQGAIIKDETTLTQIAEKQGVTGVYTVTTSRAILLEFPDVIRRESDGQIFRVTTRKGDVVTPKSSALDIAQVKAELWELS